MLSERQRNVFAFLGAFAISAIALVPLFIDAPLVRIIFDCRAGSLRVRR